MAFKDVIKGMQSNLYEMTKNKNQLYYVDCDLNKLINVYLTSFKYNTVFRNKVTFNCNCCKKFIRDFGNVVSCTNGKIKSIWDFKCIDKTYQPVLDNMTYVVSQYPITKLYKSDINYIGTEWSNKKIDGGYIHWNHLNIILPSSAVNSSDLSIKEIQYRYQRQKEIVQKSLKTYTTDGISTAIELINYKNLSKVYKWLPFLYKAYMLENLYNSFTTENEMNNLAWEITSEFGVQYDRLSHHRLGTLLFDLSNGTDVETALRQFILSNVPTHSLKVRNYKDITKENKCKTVEGHEKILDTALGSVDDLTTIKVRLDDLMQESENMESKTDMDTAITNALINLLYISKKRR